MHTMPDNCNPIGIEVTRRQTAYHRCGCGNGYTLEYNHKILDNWLHLHNLLEAMRIDSAFTGDTKSQNYNTAAMLFSLFNVMLHW